MLKGIKLDTKWAHSQNLSYISPIAMGPYQLRNPQKSSELIKGKHSLKQMKQMEYQIFGRLMF